MTYQFDPKPEGLHYQPFTVSFCNKTMWYLRDGAPDPWIDLRSMFEALGMSWDRKWKMYCLAKQRHWQLEACCDIKRRETLLAPANKIPAILGEVHGLLTNHPSAALRTRSMHSIWRARSTEFQEGQPAFSSQEIPRKQAKRSPKGNRKVTPYVVRQAYQLAQKGHKKPAIAKALSISLGSLQQLAAGTYPSMDNETKNAWWETFGALKHDG